MATSQRFGVTRETSSGWSDDVMYHDDDRDAGIASDLIKIKRRDEIESGIFLIEHLLTVTHARPSTSRDRRTQE